MSTISVTNVTTANGTTDLTLSSGNTTGPKIVATGTDIDFYSNSSTISLVSNTTGFHYTTNTALHRTTTANTLTVTGTTTANTLTVTGSFTGIGALTAQTAQATTSGSTPRDFSSIPSWVKRITVIFKGVSTSGTSIIQVQIGTGGVPTTSGYVSTTITGPSSVTTGFGIGGSAGADIRSGIATIINISGNEWVCSGVVKMSTSQVHYFGGDVTLSGTLDFLRITTVNGTDTYDAGSVNIMYE